jgi:hypothetical protein
MTMVSHDSLLLKIEAKLLQPKEKDGRPTLYEKTTSVESDKKHFGTKMRGPILAINTSDDKFQRIVNVWSRLE